MTIKRELMAALEMMKEPEKKTITDEYIYGNVVVKNDELYVIFDGSSLETPAMTTVAVSEGDRVMIILKGREAVITGNVTDPSAPTTELTNKVNKGEVTTELNGEKATVNLIGNRIVIESDNFKVSEDGTIEATNAELSGELTAGTDQHRVEIKNGDIQFYNEYVDLDDRKLYSKMEFWSLPEDVEEPVLTSYIYSGAETSGSTPLHYIPGLELHDIKEVRVVGDEAAFLMSGDSWMWNSNSAYVTARWGEIEAVSGKDITFTINHYSQTDEEQSVKVSDLLKIGSSITTEEYSVNLASGTGDCIAKVTVPAGVYILIGNAYFASGSGNRILCWSTSENTISYGNGMGVLEYTSGQYHNAQVVYIARVTKQTTFYLNARHSNNRALSVQGFASCTRLA